MIQQTNLHNLKLPKQWCACSHYRRHKIKAIFGLQSLYLWPILYLIPLLFAFIILLRYLQNKRIKQPVNTTILKGAIPLCIINVYYK